MLAFGFGRGLHRRDLSIELINPLLQHLDHLLFLLDCLLVSTHLSLLLSHLSYLNWQVLLRERERETGSRVLLSSLLSGFDG